MKHITTLTKLMILAFIVLVSSCKQENTTEKIASGVIFRGKNENLKIKFFTPKIVRVTHAPTTEWSKRGSLIISKIKEQVEISIRETSESIEIESDSLLILIEKKSGTCHFKEKDKRTILAEKSSKCKMDTVANETCYNILQSFILNSDEALYGLGQHQDGIMNWRGKEVTLVQTNVHAVSPFVISTRNYGILWDNYSKTIFKDDSTGASFWSEVADQVDYYFIAGKNMDDVIAGYRDLTGQAPMFGKWAFGYWQSKERYKYDKEILGVAKEYRDRKIPIDNIVQDWRYWALFDSVDVEKSRQSAKDSWSSMQFHPSTYSDPAGTIKEIHEKYNMHYMISIWPIVGKETEIFAELNQKGHLLPPETWTTGFLYDAYSQEARDIYWKYIRKGLMKQGVDALWMDATEPEMNDQHTYEVSEKWIKKFGKTQIGTMSRYLNPYSLVTTKGVYENWRRDIPEKRVFILTRSGFAGQQRYAAVTWSGDINATWDIYRRQISAGLNFSMAGMPYWTMDIGAFFMNGHDRGYGEGNYKSSKEPAYRELYVRWFQFGAFCPIFRSHGTHSPREAWQFGEPGSITYESLLKFDNLRYRLLPYIYSTAWRVTNQGYTMMRGLAMDFGNDPNVLQISNQYLFGPAMMVTPVTEEQYFPASGLTTREVKGFETYLPAGSEWYDFWTGEKLAGGEKTWRPTPLDIMPIYVKAGSIIPMGPFKQYSTEIPEDPIELRIYPGSDASFVLYEDENDNYNYEKGTFVTIAFSWNDQEKILTIGKREGKFPGMLTNRKFDVVIVGNEHGTGEKVTKKPDREIIYSGQELKIEF